MRNFFAITGSLFLLLTAVKPAGAIYNAKDTISTSRPSASIPLASDQSAHETQAVIYDNSSRFIASDSATFIGIGGTVSESVNVASMSATGIPSSGQRTVYFTGKITNAHSAGITVLRTPVYAKHTVSFTNEASIPGSGKIQVIFPVGNATDVASPSASGFSFNNLASNNVQISGGSLACTDWTITPSSGLVQCNLSAGATGPTSISISIGSTNPTLINPTKTAAAGTADLWTVQIKILDASSAVIEETKAKIGTVEAVEVYATVDPGLTFTIAGINTGASVRSGNLVGCGMTETVNTGFNSSATEVNLGVLGSSAINIGAQLLTVTTNGNAGYSLTATVSGHLIDPAIGYWIPDAATTTANDIPANGTALSAGTPAFGIHACGADVTGGTGTGWGPSSCGTAAGTCLYKMPTSTFYQTLASDSSGPVVGTSGNGLTTVTYGATVSNVVPAGNYHTAITYVATPVF